jgi:cytochrome P450
MVCNPEAQKKAQKEIDDVVGTHRLPNFDDRPSLPYAEALYRELMRWRPGAPLSIFRATTEDDTYKGYFIPKGAALQTSFGSLFG